VNRLQIGTTIVLAMATVSCRPVGAAPSTVPGEPASVVAASSSDLPSPVASAHPDAPAYAEAFGLSIEEATRRLDIQQQIHPLRTSLHAAVGDRWAGGWLEHEPAFRFVVRLTGEDTDEFEAMTEDWPLPVDFITGAAFTESDAIAALERIDDVLRPEFPKMGFGWEPQAGAIVMNGPDEPTAEFLAELETLAGVPVRYEYSPPETLLGG